MTYVLIIFWWGSFAGQIHTISSFSSEQSCKQAVMVIEKSKPFDGDFKMICVKTDK